MARVFLVGLEKSIADQLSKALAVERHWIVQKERSSDDRDLVGVDIVFAGGTPSQYLPLLHRTRKMRPALPFVVITRNCETKEWLDALEAGATDYCSLPFTRRQIHWLIESLLPLSLILKPVQRVESRIKWEFRVGVNTAPRRIDSMARKDRYE